METDATSLISTGAASLFVLGMALSMALRIIYHGQPSQVGDVVHFTLALVSRVMLLSVLMFFIVQPPWRVAAIPLFILIVVLIRTNNLTYAAKQRATLDLLMIALRRGVPLPDVLQSLALENGGRYANRLLHTAQSLRAGRSLNDALRKGVLSPRGRMLVALTAESGGSAGTTPIADEAMLDQGMQDIVGRIAYLTVALAVMAFVVVGIYLFIVPEFIKLFNDFEVPLPDALAFFIVSPVITVLIGFILVFALLFLSGTLLWQYVGWARAMFPWMWLADRADSVTALRLLAWQLDRARPMNEALDAIADKLPRSRTAKRLKQAAHRVDCGEDWTIAFERNHLLPANQIPILRAAETAGNLPNALRFAVDDMERTFAFKADAVLKIVGPLAVLLFGLVVGLFAVTMFTPLAELITFLS